MEWVTSLSVHWNQPEDHLRYTESETLGAQESVVFAALQKILLPSKV